MNGEAQEGEQRSEATSDERLTTSGAVEAVSQKDGRYGVRIGGEWYGGFGTCPVSEGQVCVVEYVVRGKYRNVVRVREVGDSVPRSATRASASEELPGVPVAVKNYRTPEGWEQAFLTAEEEALIQVAVRQRNAEIVEESITDAKGLLAGSGVRNAVTPRNVVELALLLGERRIVHISRVYDQYMAAKVAATRRKPPTGVEGESPSALGVGGDAV